MDASSFALFNMMRQQQQQQQMMAMMAAQQSSRQAPGGCQSCGTQGGSGSSIVDALLGVGRAITGYAQQQSNFAMMQSLMSQPGSNANNAFLMSMMMNNNGGLGNTGFNGGFGNPGFGGNSWAPFGAFGV